MILETERLYLREMEQSDFEALCKILQDEDTMYLQEWRSECFWRTMNPEIYVFRKL